MENLIVKFRSFCWRMKKRSKTMIGYPGNLNNQFPEMKDVFSYILNNAGDPFDGDHAAYRMHTKKYETDVLKYFASLYKAPEDFWGYLTSGGTEGNMHGLLVGREKFPNGVLYFSDDAHYSIWKIAKILQMEYRVVKSQENGEMDYDSFRNWLIADRPAIICPTAGTTMKGATDKLHEIFKVLNKEGVNDHYIHYDAALFGGFLPFLEEENTINFENGIDSIAISGHKFFGTPFPSGILLHKGKSALNDVFKSVDYIESLDSTILGSRMGQIPLYLWALIHKNSGDVFENEARECIRNARYLFEKLEEKAGWEPLLNENSNIVVFKKPLEDIVKKWQLATTEEHAHVVVMQHVTKKVIDEFMMDIK